MLLLVFNDTMNETHHGCCDTCKHYKRILMASQENGTTTLYGYCHASSNYARHQPQDTCKRWTADPKAINR